jgi:hypothetical protein
MERPSQNGRLQTNLLTWLQTNLLKWMPGPGQDAPSYKEEKFIKKLSEGERTCIAMDDYGSPVENGWHGVPLPCAARERKVRERKGTMDRCCPRSSAGGWRSPRGRAISNIS